MSAIPFVITNAGLAALANVGSLGPVTISKVAIGTGLYTPSATQTALQSQTKQLTPSGSTVPAPGVIHITAVDSSQDAYNVGEIGLITSTGVLFAVYSQGSNILVKGANSDFLFSLDFALSGADPDSITVGDTGFSYPAATETTLGVAAIATTSLVTAGTDDQTIVTPKKLADRVAGYLLKSGGTMVGPLALYGDPTDPAQAANKNYVDSLIQALSATYVGLIGLFPMATPPPGWIIANGSLISRATYANLFTAIGTTYGAGDGTTTFKIPDLRGEFLRGFDGGRGIDSGRILGSWQADSFASHTHGVNDPGHNHTVFFNDGANSIFGFSGPGRAGGGSTTTTTNGSNVSIQATGGAETRPRNVAFLPCIHY